MAHLIGSFFLTIGRWRIRGGIPPGAAVLAIAPHTSNWDFFWLLFAKWRLRLHPRFLGKHTLFRGPVGWFMYRLGGIPVDRSKPEGVVGQAAAAFRSDPRQRLALAPEGTRRHTRHWRSGFYEIALAAAVPVVPVAIDYGRREIVIGAPWTPTGDRAADMDGMRAFFDGVRGRRPENQGPVRLHDE